MSFVYVMTDGQHMKIGRSINPANRARELGARLLHAVNCFGSYKIVEYEAQKILTHQGRLVRGREWFDVTLDEAIAVIGEAMRCVGRDARDARQRADEREFFKLVHVQITPEMKQRLIAVRNRKINKPDFADQVREGLALYLAQEEGAA